jgi:hypothetical protein
VKTKWFAYDIYGKKIKRINIAYYCLDQDLDINDSTTIGKVRIYWNDCKIATKWNIFEMIVKLLVNETFLKWSKNISKFTNRSFVLSLIELI